MKTLATLVVSLLISVPMRAATLHADGTTCTLADAILATNTDTAVGGCPQGDTGPDTIVLDDDVTLSADDPASTLHGGVRAGLPDVTDDLTIAAGLGSVIRRDPSFTCEAATGDPVFRFLQLESGSLTLQGLSFEDGCFVGADNSNEGGGIRAATATELTLDGVSVRNHGAFATSGSLDGGFLYTEGDQLTMIGGRFENFDAEAVISLQGGLLHIDDGVVAMLNGTEVLSLEISSTVSLQGGAIYSRGQLELAEGSFEDVSWLSNGSVQGGAIYSSSGALVIQDSSFRLFVGTSQAGSSTQGGAIYATNDLFTLTDVVFSDFDLFASGSCSGGAIYTFEDGPLERLIVEQIRCRTDSFIEGAAAQFLSSAAVLRDCLFRDNEGWTVQQGRGGAVLGSRFELIERCAFVDNRLQPALSIVNPEVRGGGMVASHIAAMRNVTFAGNVAQGGDGTGADAGSAFGGGLYLGGVEATSVLAAVTFTNNQAIGGQAGAGFLDGQASGGGLYLPTGHTVELIGSILSGNTVTEGDGPNTDEDCFADGTFSSRGYNLAQDPGSGCAFAAFGDITGIDPQLYPVGDYGCSLPLPDGSCLPSAAIDQSSWAIDWSSCAEVGVGDDTRALLRRQDIAGVPNLSNDACDAGAFEARDRDGDGVTDVPDLCPDLADPDQSDSDGDSVGDACDQCAGDDASGDADGDRVCDDTDLCPGFDDFVDSDQDNVPDGCDLCLGDDATGDSDGDFVCDDRDTCSGFDDGIDSDGDSVPDGCDQCLGDDASGDSDNDGLCNDRDAAVGDRVWRDDGDGIQDGGEPGIAGITVNLYSADNSLQATTTTDGDGLYSLSPGPGDFYLEFVLPADMAYAPRDQGTDDGADSDVNAGTGTTSLFTLAAGQIDNSRDAGLEPAVIGNRVWLDRDGDGLQEAGEVGLGGVTVRLLDANGEVLATTATASDGIYGFLGLASGEYRIEVLPPMGYVFSVADAGDDHLDSDIDPSSGLGPVFSYLATSASQGWDAGLRMPPIFEDRFESGDITAWKESTP